ncbi:MAG: putative phosphatidate cytidylyltransferase [Candidatus Bathyarchaeota archaeon B24]|nr:MAG: putative phosphatidate cytidylyltransferase [Candidatus Bathyarchaeota archaeon B24]
MRNWELARESIHIALCFTAATLYNQLDLTTASVLTVSIITAYLLNEYARIKGLRTPLTRLYNRLLVGEEVKQLALSPIYLGAATLALMNLLPIGEASAAVVVAGLGDGFAGLLRTVKGEREKPSWRLKTALAGFTLAALAASLYVDPYCLPVACLVAALMEMSLMRLDDNISVPVTSGLLIHLSTSTGFNKTLREAVETMDATVYTFFKQVPLTGLTGFLTTLDAVLPVLYLALAFSGLREGRWRDSLKAVGLLAASTVLAQWAKVFFRKPRPPVSVKTGYSFPSNHAALAGVSVGYYRKARYLSALAYALSIATVVEILILGNHWFSDVVAGFLIGLFITLPIRELP